MNACHDMRLNLLTIVRAVGEIRALRDQFAAQDIAYIDRELDRLQAVAHRLFEFLDNVETPPA